MLAAMLLPLSSVAAAPDRASCSKTAALIGRLTQPPPTHTPFAEAKFSPLLSRPLVTSGELVWSGGLHLERRVKVPYAESTVIAGGEVAVTRKGHGTKHFSLDRAPPLKALLHGLVSVLSGNVKQLQQTFKVRLDGQPDASWTITLQPRAPQLARQLAGIRLDGSGNTLACMEITQKRGDVSMDLLGDLAKAMPAHPTRANLTALCRTSQ